MSAADWPIGRLASGVRGPISQSSNSPILAPWLRLAAFAALAGFGARTVADSMDKLPDELTAEPLAQRTRVLASDGSLLATFYDQNRINVPLSSISRPMVKAIVAIEDYRFYDHGALDLRGTLRAFITNQANGGSVQGGSSITQQMVKQTLLYQAETDDYIYSAT